MELVHSTNHADYYQHNGSIFSVYSFSKLTPDELAEHLENPKLLAYSEKSFDEYAKKPLTVFNVSTFGIRPQNMSLYEYLAIVKGVENTPHALNSCCMQLKYDPLVFACEPYDEESDLTDENCGIIERYIKQYAGELLELSGRDSYDVEWYM